MGYQMNKTVHSVSLNHLSEGQQAIISEILGDKTLTRRLIGLGLRVGSEITLLQQRSKGVVLGSAGSRVALGSTIANKLMIQPC